MTYSDAIKSGFRLINRNWQLMLIQVALPFVGFIIVLVFVGFPLGVAFIIFGVNLTEILRIQDISGAIQILSEIMFKYFGLVIFVLAGLLLSILAVLSLQIFVLGGSIGVISRSIKEQTEKFRMKTFLSESKQLFFPLTGFMTVVGLLFIALVIVLGLSLGVIAAMASSLTGEYDPTFATFFRIFFSLILFLVILVTLAVTLYGAAAMTLKGSGYIKSIKESFQYLYSHEDAFFLYCIIFIGSIVMIFVLLLLSYLLMFISLMGLFLAFIVQLFIVYVVQNYLLLVIIAITFIYYFSTEIKPKETTELSAGPTAEGSSQAPDTSLSQASEPLPPLPEKEAPE